MGIKSEDVDKIREIYQKLFPKYEKLGVNLKQALEIFLKESNIDYLTVDYRTKDVDPFIDKIKRKNYKDPFNQIEDICGLRIICYYKNDIQKISDIIKREFKVLEAQDKEELLNVDQFGYRSSHFIVKIRRIWSKTPNYRKLENLKAEIQVRTVLMHAWCEIEHKLAYKKKAHIPDQFKRKLYRMSANLEDADEKFEELRNDINIYRKELIDKANKESGIFDKSLPLNLDNLQAFLDYYLPDRKRDINDTRSLLDELFDNNVTMKDLVEAYQKVKNYLPEVEIELFKSLGGSEEDLKNYPGKKIWTQCGATRYLLDIVLDEYFKVKEEIFPYYFGSDPLPKWREIIRKKNKK